MSHSHESEPNFEKLSKAITEAVVSSEKVKRVMAELQKKEDICPQSFMVLVLKMQVLADALTVDVEGEEEEREIKAPKKKKATERSQYIDGRKLSKNELKFQEYRNKDFDSDEWLKNNGLSF
ncbi:MAG: hypothetical protein G3M78_05455 [Candidatus Nitrohelix vancouverensis]|uniref:Uncharacterized protein n=1 Tax=Candidatus Nitrohelix vancouverensis TaxID=2705534 RepID=A0A7T0G342_9BACT|nr:MAG: hypothetical protein G3M78_05455 [Candidatus Nitrohelix vancouverensis]